MAKKQTNGGGTRTIATEYIHVPDSIEVTKNAKDEYSWKMKVYWDSGEGTENHEAVVKKLKAIDTTLRKTFK